MIKKEVEEDPTFVHSSSPHFKSGNLNSTSASKSKSVTNTLPAPQISISAVKPNVSITPISSRNSPSGITASGDKGGSMSKPPSSSGGSGGIEIIPLSRVEVAASGLSSSHSGDVHKSSTSSSLKEFRPDSSDKRKSGSLGSNSGSSNSSSSSSKKRKYDDNGSNRGSSSSSSGKTSSAPRVE